MNKHLKTILDLNEEMANDPKHSEPVRTFAKLQILLVKFSQELDDMERGIIKPESKLMVQMVSFTLSKLGQEMTKFVSNIKE